MRKNRVHSGNKGNDKKGRWDRVKEGKRGRNSKEREIGKKQRGGFSLEREGNKSD